MYNCLVQNCQNLCLKCTCRAYTDTSAYRACK